MKNALRQAKKRIKKWDKIQFLRPTISQVMRVLRRNSSQQELKQLRQRCHDWAELGFYQQANATLPVPAADENRVIFFGDSITECWDLATYFPHKPYINRGIPGQTTPQMLIRFRADVIALQPKVVLILAGTNDIAGNTGPMTLEMIQNNYASIAQLAQINGIRVIFASVLPIHDYGTALESESRPPAQIQSLNHWLRCYCLEHQHLYLDYYSAMLDNQNMLRAEFADDGLHPNAAGYAVMTPLAEKAIEQALKA